MKTDIFERHHTGKFLMLILFLALVLRLSFFSGYSAGDDRGYIAKAFSYSTGNYIAPETHWGSRSGVVVPTAIMFKILGVNQLSTVILPFILSLFSIVITYKMATYLFGPKTGILAAFLLSIFPMDVLFASQLFPYEFLVFFSISSLYLFIIGMDKSQGIFVFYSGFLLGLAYLSRITALYCLLFYAAYFIFKKEKKYTIYFIAGLVLVFILEATASFIFYNDWFLRLGILMGRVSGGGVSPGILDKFTDVQWVLEPFIRFCFEQEFALFFPFMLFAVFYQIFNSDDKKASLLLLWIIPIFLYVAYGTTKPTGYGALRRLPRYYSVVIAPALILLSFVLTKFKNQKISIAIIFLLFITSIVSLTIDNSKFVKRPSIQMTEFVNSKTPKNIIIDRVLMFDYLFFIKFERKANLAMLVNKADNSDTLKRIKLVYPDIKMVNTLENIPDQSMVVLSPRYYKVTDTERLHLKHIKDIEKEHRFYYQIFEFAPVQMLMKFVRDEKRFKMLVKRTKKTASIYTFNDKI